jgi:NADPH:quinone reductase-like Zn-dependent oxidoreductase
MVRGEYNPRQRLPLIPMSDGVGEVVAVGSDVTRVAVGDRVAPIFAQRWIAGEAATAELRTTLGGPLDGVLSELVMLDEEGLVLAPAGLSDVEAATLPCAGVTAWSALVTHGRVHAGEVVVIQGTGGVSLFALQIAKLHGARVIATSSSDEKLARLRALGADETVNYRTTPEWSKVVSDITGGRGADHVVEVVGGENLAQSLRAVRPFGRVSLIGNLAGSRAEVMLTAILMRNVRVQGIIVGPRTAFEALVRAVAHHDLRPVVDRVFRFGGGGRLLLPRRAPPLRQDLHRRDGLM